MTIFLGVATSAAAQQVALDTGHHSSPGSSGAPAGTTTLHFDKVFREDQQDGTSHWNQQVTGFFWALFGPIVLKFWAGFS